MKLVEGSRADTVYVNPDADFSIYSEVYISEVRVSFRKNWMRDQNADRRSVTQKVTQEDADQIKAALAEEFTRIFTEELEEAGYTVVTRETAKAEEVLALRPAIVDLDVTAPDTMSPGRTRSYTTSAGSMTLFLEFYDSLTGTLLGRVEDTQREPETSYIQVSSSVSNKAEADRILRRWARALVAKLDAVHGK